MSVQRGKPKTSRSLATTLVITFLALTLAALLIASLSVLFFFVQSVLESVDSQQQLAAKEAANEVSSFVEEKFSELEATVKIGEPTLASEQEQRDVLGNLLGLVPAFRQLILFDSDDQELVQVSRLSEAESGQLAGRVESDLFLRTRQGNRYVSPVYVDDVTSEPQVIMAVPALDAFGDYQGTLLAEVNLKFMWDLVDRLQVGETGQAYVVDKEGNLLASGDISRVLRGENVGQLDVVGDFMDNPVPVGEAATSMVQGIEGTAVVGTYVPLGLPDWAVVAELPIMEAFQPGIQSTVILGAVMLVAAALVGLVAVYSARRLAAPLLDLTSTAGRIAEGEMDLRAVPKGAAEIADLAEAFNTMTAQLQELIASLEQRVADRTRELEQRAVQLETAANVGRAAASILELDVLTRRVVELVQEGFDFYYAGLFLLDQAGQYAVLEAGTGEAGRIMKEAGHQLEVGGLSMVGTACARGQARIALDVAAMGSGVESVRFDNPLLPDTRSEMALPLMVADRVIGALDVQSTQPAAFSEEDIAVLQLVADQVAVAIDNARKFSEEAGLLEATSPLYRVSRRLATAVTTDEIVQAVIGSVAETEADGCAVGRLDLSSSDEGEAATFLGSWDRHGGSGFPVGVSFDASASPFPLDMAKTFWVVEDVTEDGSAPETFRKFLGRFQGRAFVNVPLLAGQRVIGFVSIYRTAPGPFSPVSLRLYETLVDQAAVALERARLLEETQGRADRERFLGEVTTRMRETLDVRTVLQTAADELYEALGLEKVVIHLAAEENGDSA